jgi:two-component system chemotaxis response regulator CheY
MDILIVDDSKAMRCIIARALREIGIPGSPYLEAANGKAALQVIESSAPALVISDLNMPEMSGMELLQALRQTGNPIPFGFVTSEASMQLRLEAADAGAVFVVTKPFTAANLSQSLGPVFKRMGCQMQNVDVDVAEALDGGAGFPKPVQVAAALAELLRRGVTATATHPLPLPPVTRVVAEYRSTEDNSLTACGICDLALAARAGAALTLIPVPVSEEVIRSHVIEDTLADNLHEVLNVMARFFDHVGHSRVHLGAVHLPGEKLGTELVSRILKPLSRLDLAVEIAGYRNGTLSLLSFGDTASVINKQTR